MLVPVSSVDESSVDSNRLHNYSVQERRVLVGGRAYALLGPANYESLIDDPAVVRRFAADEFMPYWAEFWPVARLLAEEVASWGRAEEQSGASQSENALPPTVLEIGCGLGLIGLVAHALGYRVTLSDYEEDGLAFVRASAKRNGLSEPATAYVDWRLNYPDLRCDRVVAADVLYEPRNLIPIAAFLKRHLNRGGFAVLVDSNRQAADAFPMVAADAGLQVSVEQVSRHFVDSAEAIHGRFFRLSH